MGRFMKKIIIYINGMFAYNKNTVYYMSHANMMNMVAVACVPLISVRRARWETLIFS